MTTKEEFNEEVCSIRANVGGYGNTKWSLECIVDYADTLEAQLKAKDEEIERLKAEIKMLQPRPFLNSDIN
jgi:hypothetical protein